LLFPETVIARIDPFLPRAGGDGYGAGHDGLPLPAGLGAASPRKWAEASVPLPLRAGRIAGGASASVNVRYKVNTYSIEAVDVFFSSGKFCMTLSGWREPTSTAMYCLPFTE
jgi:hypothetical protein